MLRNLNGNRAIRLNNVVCPYCGRELTSENTSREHVIGRRFVPKGKLENRWNLILNACTCCNNRKADLEDDISAITLYRSSGELSHHSEDSVNREADHKASKSISRRTKKLVRESSEKITFKIPLGSNASAEFKLISPPQMDEQRAFDLARLQLSGFYYFITYQENLKRGFFWPGGFHPLVIVRHEDFGQSLVVDFAEAVHRWEPRFLGYTADGYYRVLVRRHPHAECWSWAIEWNKTTRLVGFIGDRDAAMEITKKMRPLEMDEHVLGNGRIIRVRREIPVSPSDYMLFEVLPEK